MRICRFSVPVQSDSPLAARWGLYDQTQIVAVDRAVSTALGWAEDASWEAALPLGSPAWSALQQCIERLRGNDFAGCERLATAGVQLLPPVARPPKLLLLAGNYSEHVREHGETPPEKAYTFPYVFMKPPSTTLIGGGTAFHLPACSPAKIDHEVELGVVIGRTVRSVAANQALAAVLGYTVINDISDRGFRPNPDRQPRPRDSFFDWLHGKWHDGSCPCGPCLLTADVVPDPQQLPLSLTVDGQVHQSGSTSQMIMSVAELIAFISSFVTLEPGDIIATGTPSGVGNASGRYLQAGQTMVATIDPIGSLVTPVRSA